MALKAKMDPIVRLDFDTSGLTTSWQLMDAGGLTDDAQVFKMLNNSDVDVEVSYDGTNAHDFLPANGGGFVWDLTTNAEADFAALPRGQKIWLKGASSGTGSVYAMGFSQNR